MLDNPNMLLTLSAVAATRAGTPRAFDAVGLEPQDAVFAVACARSAGFVTKSAPGDLTDAGLAWAAAQLSPLRPLIARVAA